MEYPSAFLEEMNRLLGDESPAFFRALAETPPVSIRLNSKKQLPELPLADSIPWCSDGYYLKNRPVFTLDPHFHAGAYYVQEASSMMIGHIIRQLTEDCGPLLALDLCAAPGGKSTLLADHLPENSFLIANEVIKSRYKILEENLAKWGVVNLAITNQDSKKMSQLKGMFDLILVDAPCSGEGLFRKNPQAVNEWSEDSVRLCTARQKRILANAAPLLKPNGILIYSTCTFNSEENEGNARWVSKTFNLTEMHPDIPSEWNLARRPFGYQCYPHRTNSEGFYFCCLRSAPDHSHSRPKIAPSRHFKQLPKKHWETVNYWLANPKKWYFYENRQGRICAIHKYWNKTNSRHCRCLASR